MCAPPTLAKKKEITTSQTTVLLAAANMSGNDKVCVRRPTEAPRIAQAPLGKGDRMNPQMTATNSDRRDHACAAQWDERVCRHEHLYRVCIPEETKPSRAEARGAPALSALTCKSRNWAPDVLAWPLPAAA